MYELKVLTPKYKIPEVLCVYNVNRINNLTSEPQVKTKSATSKENKSQTCAFDLLDIGEKIQQAIMSSTNVEGIVARQQEVLQQLESLQKHLAEIRGCYKQTTNTVQPKVQAAAQQFSDIVVNAHPNQIPYTLLALRNAWRNSFNFQVQIFKHSNMPTISKEAQIFEQQLSETIVMDAAVPTIMITLVWIDCEQTELISSLALYVPIYGEINVLRYLTRIGPLAYNYEASSYANEIDSILDICHQFLHLKSGKSKKVLLNHLTSCLENEFLFGADISAADIAVYCILKQGFNAKDLNLATKELNSKFAAWRNRMKSIVVI